MILRLATFAMGTRFECVLAGGGDAPAGLGDRPRAEGGEGRAACDGMQRGAGGDRGASERRLRAAGEAALEAIEEADARLSLFRRESLLAHVNRCAARRPVRLDLDTFELLEECERVRRESGGAFDVAVAPAMRAIGFHADALGDGFAARDVAGRPVRAGIESPGLARGAPRSITGGAASPSTRASYVLDGERREVRFVRDGVALDLGAIGKGHALDLAAARLRELGISCAFLHGGTSSAIAIGAPHGSDGWGIAIESPGGAGARRSEAEAPVVTLRDSALSVSATHGSRLPDGRGHVLDPRTGRPIEGERIAAVVARTARLAEAWSTAVLVLGRLPEVGADANARADGIERAILGVGPAGAREWRELGPEVRRSHGARRTGPIGATR